MRWRQPTLISPSKTSGLRKSPPKILPRDTSSFRTQAQRKLRFYQSVNPSKLYLTHKPASYRKSAPSQSNKWAMISSSKSTKPACALFVRAATQQTGKPLPIAQYVKSPPTHDKLSCSCRTGNWRISSTTRDSLMNLNNAKSSIIILLVLLLRKSLKEGYVRIFWRLGRMIILCKLFRWRKRVRLNG